MSERIDRILAVARLADWAREDHQPVQLSLSRQNLFALVSSLQLALRHPAFPAAIADILDPLIRDMQGRMPEDIRQISLLGARPEHDIPVEDPHA